MSSSSGASGSLSSEVIVPVALEIETSTLAILVSSYNRHFDKYCQGRVKPTQLVPALVWRNVYADYLKFRKQVAEEKGVDVSTMKDFREDTLKKQLRTALASIGTGRSDDPKGNASLQNEDVLRQLKQQDDHKRRLMNSKRMTMIQKNSMSGNAEQDSESAAASSKSKQSMAGSAGTNQSKAELMRRSVDALDVIAEGVTTNGSRLSDILSESVAVSRKRYESVDAREDKRLQLDQDNATRECKRMKLEEAKAVLENEKAKRESIRMQLDELKFLKDNGVLTEDDFAKRALELVGIRKQI